MHCQILMNKLVLARTTPPFRNTVGKKTIRSNCIYISVGSAEAEFLDVTAIHSHISGSSSLKPIPGGTTSTGIDSQNYLWCIHNTYITWNHRSIKSQKATLLSSLLNCTESSMNIIISCSLRTYLDVIIASAS